MLLAIPGAKPYPLEDAPVNKPSWFGPFALLALMAMACTAQAQLPGAEIIRLDDSFDALVAPGTAIEKVAGDFKFTEGPMWHQGRLWISDVVADTIFAVSPSGSVATLVTKAGGYPNPPPGSYLGPNAMVTDKDGSVLLAQQGGRKIMRIDAHLALQPFLDGFGGKRFNSPNDLVFAPDGSLYCGSPTRRTDWPAAMPIPAKELRYDGVYRYADGKSYARGQGPDLAQRHRLFTGRQMAVRRQLQDRACAW